MTSDFKHGNTRYRVTKDKGLYLIFMDDEGVWIHCGSMRASGFDHAMMIFLRIIGEDH